MRGRRQLGLAVRRAPRRFLPRRSAGLGPFDHRFRVDQPRPRREVIRIEQPLRHVHEILVRHVEVAVGEGEFGGFDEQVLRLCARPERRKAEGFEHAEDLPDRQPPRTRRPHPADLECAVIHADRRSLDHLVKREIVECHLPGVDLGRDRGDDIPRDRAVVEGCGPVLGDHPECAREVRVLEEASRSERLPVLVEEIFPRRLEPAEPAHLGFRDRMREPGRDLEPLLGKPDRRRDEFRPGNAPMTRMQFLEKLQRPRHTHRTAADDRLLERHRLARLVEPVILARCHRRRLAPVITCKFPFGRAPVEGEGTTADP